MENIVLIFKFFLLYCCFFIFLLTLMLFGFFVKSYLSDEIEAKTEIEKIEEKEE